jgi:predicted RNA methylase
VKSNLLAPYDAVPCHEDLTPREGVPAELTVAHVREALRMRRDPGDRIFDRLLPRSMAVVSSQFWTPLVVVVRVARWFDELGIETVVDVGSGVGKFGTALALCGRYVVIGMEQRARLVLTARRLARSLGVENRVHFLHGTFGEQSAPAAAAYYFFNPFGENLFFAQDYLDREVELSRERYYRDIAATEQILAGAQKGTFVVTYNGFGGTLPASYSEVKVARDLPNVLRVSCKVR